MAGPWQRQKQRSGDARRAVPIVVAEASSGSGDGRSSEKRSGDETAGERDETAVG